MPVAVDLLDRIASTENLPSLPLVAMEVLKLTKDPDATVDDLAMAIQNDPALTSKVLKVVNSAMFGLSRQVGTIKHAVALLGMRTVKIMALSFSLVDTIRDTDVAFDMEAFWRRSLTTAVGARMLGSAAKSPMSDEAFVCGLLSGVGMMAAWRGAPEVYAPLLKRVAAGEHQAEVEINTLGFTYAQMSGRLLEAWGLPEPVCQAVGAANGETLDNLSGSTRQLADAVHAATTMASLFCGEIPPSELANARAYSIDLLKITPDAFDDTLKELHRHVQDTASMLSVPIGKTVNYAMLQVEAAQEMARLSMQTEVERATIAKQEENTRRENEKLAAEKQVMERKATTDALTGIANRAAFDQRVSDLIANRADSLTLIILDVDHFKKFNDTHGHQAGDAVLKEVAGVLQKACGDRAFAARYGGEEFVAISAGLSGPVTGQLAELIRKSIERHAVRFESKDLRVTSSFGLAIWDGAESAAAWVKRADAALYRAKAAGRNRVCSA
ncbi:MAG: GGDEF domain-containing protein [Phycisphaerales bacterium]|nr:GGDEF domain-containing protein [Phycisphaerales bacterium]